MFFAPITPEMAKYITDARREQERKSRKIPTFKEFYDKKYSEELAKLCKFPSVSFSMAMVLANLPKFVNEKAKKEYEQLYNIKV